MQFFTRLFQTPEYLHLASFGIDISDNSFKYIKLREAGNGLVIDEFGSAPIPAGIIEAGIIKKPQALTPLIQETFKNKKHFRHVALSLPEEQGFVRMLRLPRMPEDEIGEAVSLQLEDHIPLSAEEAVFDYEALPSADAAAEYVDVLVVAYPKLIVDSYLQVISDAGLIPIVIEMEAQAIGRAIIPVAEENKTILVVDIGLTRTSFLISRNGFVQFTSTVPIGGKHIHEAIAKALNMPIKEAERLKIKLGLEVSPNNQQVYSAILPIMQSVKDEIQKRIDFWQSNSTHPGSKELHSTDKVYLCGGDANMAGLPHHLSLDLITSVELANVWVNVVTDPSYIPEIEFRESLSYATCIGLALGSTDKTIKPQLP